MIDQPGIARGAFGLQLAQFHLVVLIDHQGGGLAFQVAGHALLRGQNGLGADPSLQLCVDEHAGQQVMLGVGEYRSQGHGTGAGIDRHFGELQLAGLRVLAAVFQQQFDRGGVVAGLLQAAAGQVVAQLEDFQGRLGDVDVDRVELLDHRHGSALAIAHQRALADRRAADAPGDRRQHLGVAQVDGGRLQRGLGFHLLGPCFVELLAADRLFIHQQLIALGQRLAGLQGGLGAFQGRGIECRVDLVQLLTGFYFPALGEQALENDAVDLWPHFGDAIGTGTPWQLGGEGKCLGLQGDHADLGRRRCGGGRLLFAGAEQGGQADGQEQGGNGGLV